jgi:hypothetical protein
MRDIAGDGRGWGARNLPADEMHRFIQRAFAFHPQPDGTHLVAGGILGGHTAHAGGEILELPREIPRLHAGNLRRADAVVAIAVGAVAQQAVVEVVARVGATHQEQRGGERGRDAAVHAATALPTRSRASMSAMA